MSVDSIKIVITGVITYTFDCVNNNSITKYNSVD